MTFCHVSPSLADIGSAVRAYGPTKLNQAMGEGVGQAAVGFFVASRSDAHQFRNEDIAAPLSAPAQST